MAFKKNKVAVIGAGLAGLTAAYRLFQNGIDVQVYEARSRVGGRVLSAYVDGHVVELGAKIISDGGQAHHLHQFIKKLGLEINQKQARFNPHYLAAQDQLISVREKLQACNLNPDTLDDEIYQKAHQSKNMRELLNYLFDRESFLRMTFDAFLTSYEGIDTSCASTWYKNTLYHMMLGGVCSAHKGDEEILHNAIKGGNSLLPEKLAGVLDGRVFTQMPLQAVSKTINNAYLLEFKDGQVVEADLLILAVPCSVYKDIRFDVGVMPSERLEAIKQVQYGTNGNVIAPLSRPFEKKMQFFNERFIAFTNLNNYTMTFYYIGKSGIFTAADLPALYQKDKALIECFLGGSTLSLLDPVMARDEQLGVYETPVAYSWPDDPYARGSYFYIAAGQEDALTTVQEYAGESVIKLFMPIDQTLYFAGEHASILLDVPGTMEAACESGERTARMIEKRVSSGKVIK